MGATHPHALLSYHPLVGASLLHAVAHLHVGAKRLPVGRTLSNPIRRFITYFSKCLRCSLSWWAHGPHDGRCPACGDAVKLFVGKAIDPPSRAGTPPGRAATPTPQPAPQREEGEGPGCAATPTPPPAPQREEGGDYVDPSLSALDRALSGPRRTTPSVDAGAGPRRTMEPSRQRLRSEEGSTIGPVETMASMIGPSVMFTAARDVVGHGLENPSLERWEDVRRLTEYDSVHWKLSWIVTPWFS